MALSLESRVERLNNIISKEPVDISELQRLSREEGGFIDNKLRSQIWPKLLAINRYDIPDFRRFIEPHRDDMQIKCDVDRSLWNLDVNVDWDRLQRERRRASLSNIMKAILCRNPHLYYYQVQIIS